MNRQVSRILLAGLLLSLAPSLSRAAIQPAGGRDLVPDFVMQSMQEYMVQKRFDGWLFSGQGSFGDIEREFLGLQGKTRYRWFILYPAMVTLRKPFLIYHPADEKVFSGINFYSLPYRSRVEMIQQFRENFFPIARVVGVDYSPKLAVPEISRADAGLVEFLQSENQKVISSGTMLSFFNTRWRTTDVATHQTAAARLDSLLPLAVGYLRDQIMRGRQVTDYDLLKFIGKNFKRMGLEPVADPVVAVGEKTLEASYTPEKKNPRRIAPGDLVYLELAARPLESREGMFARLGWSLFAGDSVPDSLARKWEEINEAADEAIGLLKLYIPREKVLRGYQVDQAARGHLSGGPNVLPRPVGFNLNPYGHSFGVCFDNYIAEDDREIMPGMGFTLEPGIYGSSSALRLCANVYIDGQREVTVTPLQRRIIAVTAGPGQQ